MKVTMVRCLSKPIRLALALCFVASFSGCNSSFPGASSADNSVSVRVPVESGVNPSDPSHPEAEGESGYLVGGTGGSGGDGGYVDQRRPAKLEVAPASFDFGVQSLGSLNYATFTVKNIGEKTATNLRAGGLADPYSFREGAYPGLHGTCLTSLSAGASCQMVITYQPQALGHFPLGTFTLTYDADDPDQEVVIPLDGSATDIATLRFWNITDDGTSFDFGTVAYGSSVTKTITVRYWGAHPASGVTFTGLTAPFSIVSNGCAEQVQADCQLVIRYDATQVGSQQQKLKVTYDNSSYTAEDNHTFLGTTSPQVLPATLTIAGRDFGTELTGSSTDQVLVVSKGGTLPAANVSGAAFTSGAFAFKGGSYPGTGGSCASLITASCTLVVTFAPGAVQSFADTVTLSFSDGVANRSASAAVHGVGAGPAVLTLIPSSDPVDFGTQPVGSPATVMFQLQNSSGSVPATGVSITGVTAPFTNLGGCGSTIAPGASCKFWVRFTPAAVGGATSPLAVSYFDGQTAQNNLQRTLQGEGSAAAVLGSPLQVYDFGTVFLGDTASATLSFQYFGADTAAVSSVSVSVPFGFVGGSYPGTGGSCSNAITKNCTVEVQFAPTAVGLVSGPLTVTFDDGTGTTQSVTILLKGTGAQKSPAVLTLSPTSLGFGSVLVGQSRQLTLTVTQAGNWAATQMTASGLSGDFTLAGGTCGTSLASGSCTLVVSFSPTASGTRGPETLTLSYFDGTASRSVTAAVSGSGNDEAILVGSSGQFASVAVGNSADITVTVTNQGTRSASAVAAAGGLTAPLSLGSSACPSSLAVGASCTLTFHFAPTAPGTFNQTFSLGYDGGNGATNLGIALTASGTVPALVAAGGNFSCARVPTGQVECWGQNNYGQLGLGDTSTRLSPRSSAPLGTGRYPVQLAVGFFHACAVLDDGALKCWGMNQYGELGLGTTAPAVGDAPNEMGDQLAAVNLGTGRTVKQLALGYTHSCALLDDGGVKCWGDNSEGQLGYGDSSPRGLAASDLGDNLPEIDLGGMKATQISANTSHTCALLENGNVKCWGNNFFGQLGLNDFTNRGDEPNQMGADLPVVSLGTGRTARQVVAGSAFTCALLDTGDVKCWGRNDPGIQGRLWCQDTDGNVGLCSDSSYPLALRGYGIGAGQMGDALPVVALGTGRHAVSLSAGNSHTCALLDDGSLKCWGQNGYGQLGLGDTNPRGETDADMGDGLLPVALGSGLSISALSAGSSHACVVLGPAQVKCWGYNHYGQLGLGDTTNRGDAPLQMGTALPFEKF